MANEVASRGIVARLLSRFGAQADGSQSLAAGQRIGKYGESYVLSPGSPKSLLAEEGSYFSANNFQTGVIGQAAGTSFTAINPFFLIQNTSSPGSGGPLITLDYVTAICTVIGGATATSVQAAVVKDTVLRYTSGGTALTPQRANSAGAGSVAAVYAGLLVATAASGAVATPVGQRTLKPTINAVGDLYTFQFGSMDGWSQVSLAGTVINAVQAAPPVVLNPGESGLIYFWWPGQSTTGTTMLPEMGWWEK
jgi:hypothetical protein